MAAIPGFPNWTEFACICLRLWGQALLVQEDARWLFLNHTPFPRTRHQATLVSSDSIRVHRCPSVARSMGCIHGAKISVTGRRELTTDGHGFTRIRCPAISWKLH